MPDKTLMTISLVSFFRVLGRSIQRATRWCFSKLFQKQDTPRVHWPVLVLLMGLFLTYLVFGLDHLGKFQTADEDLWYANPAEGRIHEYWRAMRDHNWAETRINDKPGVTTALIAGSLGYRMDTEPKAKILQNDRIIDRYNPELFERTVFFFQLPLVLTNSVLILLSFWLLFRYTKSDILALFVAGCLFLSPSLIGISQVVNPDATVWSFGFTATLAYLVFLKTGHFRYLLLSIPLLGLALLSKYSTVFIVLFSCFMTFVHLFFEATTFTDRVAFARHATKLFLGLPLFIAGGIGIFALLMPAAILNPELILKGTIAFRHAQDMTPLLKLIASAYGIVLLETLFLRSRLLYPLFTKLAVLRLPLLFPFTGIMLVLLSFVAFNWGLDNFFNLKDVNFDSGNDRDFRRLDLHNKLFLELKPIVFTLPPILFTLSLFSLFFASLRRHRYTLLFFAASSFIVLFYGAILMQNILVNVRYSALLYPFMFVIAAIGVTLLLELLRVRRLFSYSILLVFFVLLGVETYSYRPFYFNYTGDLLPMNQIVTGAWGLGGYEAAQVLNTLPNAEKMIVWADYEGFCPFFKGRCIKGSIVKFFRGGTYDGVDYFVVSRRGLLRNKGIWQTLTTEQKIEKDPLWTLHIGGREENFVKIYRASQQCY